MNFNKIMNDPKFVEIFWRWKINSTTGGQNEKDKKRLILLNQGVQTFLAKCARLGTEPMSKALACRVLST